MQTIRLPPGDMSYITDHTDQVSICPEGSRSRTVVEIDHTDHTDRLSEVMKKLGHGLHLLHGLAWSTALASGALVYL